MTMRCYTSCTQPMGNHRPLALLISSHALPSSPLLTFTVCQWQVSYARAGGLPLPRASVTIVSVLFSFSTCATVSLFSRIHTMCIKVKSPAKLIAGLSRYSHNQLSLAIYPWLFHLWFFQLLSTYPKIVTAG